MYFSIKNTLKNNHNHTLKQIDISHQLTWKQVVIKMIAINLRKEL